MASTRDEWCCAICLDGSAVATWMPCGHSFHGGCIDRWLLTRSTCPVCRYPISAPELAGAAADEHGEDDQQRFLIYFEDEDGDVEADEFSGVVIVYDDGEEENHVGHQYSYYIRDDGDGGGEDGDDLVYDDRGGGEEAGVEYELYNLYIGDDNGGILDGEDVDGRDAVAAFDIFFDDVSEEERWLIEEGY